MNFTDKSGYGTKIEIHNEKGELELITTNVTALGGRMGIETIFNTTGFRPEKHLTLAKSLEIQKNNPTSFLPVACPDTIVHEDFKNRKVEFFCIGTGGVTPTSPLTVAKPRSYETRPYEMVPFRCVTTPLTGAEAEKYRMCRKETFNGAQYYTYYLKKFDPGKLNVVDSSKPTQDYTPQYSHSNIVTPGSTPKHELESSSILVFYQFALNIEPDDFKEYYLIHNEASLVGCNITEFGLVIAEDIPITGGEVTREVRNAELWSKIVHSPTYIEQAESAKRITYTILS